MNSLKKTLKMNNLSKNILSFKFHDKIRAGEDIRYGQKLNDRDDYSKRCHAKGDECHKDRDSNPDYCESERHHEVPVKACGPNKPMKNRQSPVSHLKIHDNMIGMEDINEDTGDTKLDDDIMKKGSPQTKEKSDKAIYLYTGNLNIDDAVPLSKEVNDKVKKEMEKDDDASKK